MIYVCIVFPITVLAVFAAYFYGKKKGKEFVLSDNSTENQMPVASNNKYVYNESLGRGKHFIQKYEMVTVLLADIKGFTEIADSLDPETLLDELDSFFLIFDSIIDRFQIEKIKTMGDAYMCAGGILYKNHTNPMDVVLLALEVQYQQQKESKNKENPMTMRIGIHTGPVIAGMLGQKKLTFDIWGHTVNVAARMETACLPGKIKVSETTYEKIKKYFVCEYQGIAPRTNEGSYTVHGLKDEFVDANSEGLHVPNREYFIQMQLLRLSDLEEHVVSMMTNTALNMFFHNFKHTMEVYKNVGMLAQQEGVDDEEILLLKTAALLHDIGYSIAYEADISNASEEISREFLPAFQYKPQQIDRITKLMKASHYDSKPKDIGESIMHDANHLYYGQTGYPRLVLNLLLEEEEHKTSVDRIEWMQNQSNRLINHQFYTQSAKSMINMTMDQQITNLYNLIL